MRFRYRTTVIFSAFVVGLVALFVVLNHKSDQPCFGCGGMPLAVLVAKSPIAEGTKGSVVAAQMTSDKAVLSTQMVKGALTSARDFRGEVTARRIARGEQLTAADFRLSERIYYPSSYPKTVPRSQTPAKMHLYFGPQSSDLALAPGVWVDGAPAGADIDVHVANGTLLGYCGSVRTFEAHNPEIRFAAKCWRK